MTMNKTDKRLNMLVASLAFFLFTAFAGSILAKDETPGQHFDRAMKEFAEHCTKVKSKPNDRSCDRLKLKPADPLATEEGRFAHSIKIPHPVPDDSGYKPGMTPVQYFEHLCKNEAGEFVYKTVEGVDGFLLMRPRKMPTDYELENLYALEAPYIEVHGEYNSPGEYFVQPNMGKYQFVEVPILQRQGYSDQDKYLRYYRDEKAHPGRKYQTAIDGKGVFVPYILAEAPADALKSKYGVTWRGITRSHDRELGIAGSETIVLSLETNEVLAVRRGFKRTGKVLNLTGVWWLTGQTCPKVSERPDHWFVRDVLKPQVEN
jgi:hypothetical protein